MTDEEDTRAEFAAAADDLLERASSKESAELWFLLAEAGWFDALVPEDLGGFDIGTAVVDGVFRAVGRHKVETPIVDDMITLPLLLPTIPDGLRAELLARKVPVVLLDSRLCADEGRPNSLALDGDEVSGTVAGVRGGHRAGGFIVSLELPSGEGQVGWVDADGGGVAVVERRSLDPGTTYSDVRLDHASWVPFAPAAAELISTVRAVLRLAASSEMVGLMRHMLDASVSYAEQRHQFGRPIGSFAPVQHILADMTTATLLSESLAARAAAAIETGDLEMSVVANAFVSKSARAVGQGAMQVHGGIAFTEDFDLHRWFLRLLSLETVGGEAAVLAERVGRGLLDD